MANRRSTAGQRSVEGVAGCRRASSARSRFGCRRVARGFKGGWLGKVLVGHG